MIIFRTLRRALLPCIPPTPRTSRNLSASHNPKLGNSPDFFRYTSGRWLYNESLRLKERILHFDVQELKKAAATAVGKHAEDVQSFHKLAEGGFNRAFELTIDGCQVVARLPYPSTYPKHFSVASEVATMDLARSYGVPVPKVWGYSTTSNNAVGAEYIIMEKIQGRDLGDIWYELSEKERIKVVAEVAELESVLFSIPLPAFGSIYYKRDLEDGTAAIDIPSTNEVDSSAGQLCIGPDVAQKWWYDKRDQLSVSRGPFLEADKVFTAGAEKELAWLKEHARPRLPYIIPHRELYDYQNVSPTDHVVSIEKYLQIARHLVPRKSDYLLRPTLRHSDFQPRNIFVDDDFRITSVIDWQHCSVLPLVLQAGVPEYFQNFGDEASLRLKKPSLPESFNDMNAADQEQALEQYRRRQIHYYYFVATYKFNKPHFDALCQDSTLPMQKLQQYASTPWEGDNITLKAQLIRAVINWEALTASKDGSVPTCPIDFSDEEVESCFRFEEEQNDIDAQMEKIRNRLGVGTDGWTPHGRYEDALLENEHVKAEAVDGQDNATKNEVLGNWPFDNHEE